MAKRSPTTWICALPRRGSRRRARALGSPKSYLYPQVDGGASYSVRQASNAPTDGTEERHHPSERVYGFRLSWEIDLFGRIRREKEAAFAVMLASRAGARGVVVTLVGDIASTYFALRELDLRLDLARRTLRAE